MDYFGRNNRPTHVALLVFRQSQDGDHEILVGRRPDADQAFFFPTRELEYDQPETHAARCLSEVNFGIELSATDVTFRKSFEFGNDRTNRVRAFYLRSTPEFDAVASDGELRLGWKYEFIHLSKFWPPKQLFLIPGVDLDWVLVGHMLDEFMTYVEPHLSGFVEPHWARS
ncbi:hypothetical protein F4678DRAFT_460660 [Xylaria arbuscula]|nr:hypothetical protein F4678DRAFT_460660 [Xylaria arbuscula]